MNITQHARRIHPLMAVAAVSVTLVSLLGIAALTGVLPSSHGLATTAPGPASQNALAPAPSPLTSQVNGNDVPTRRTVARHVPNNAASHSQSTAGQAAQGEAPLQPAPAPVQQKQAAAPHNSPVGIGVGAVIGGLLGNQVGSGDGKTLATIAGAVGGGYLGNEVAKRNQ